MPSLSDPSRALVAPAQGLVEDLGPPSEAYPALACGGLGLIASSGHAPGKPDIRDEFFSENPMHAGVDR